MSFLNLDGEPGGRIVPSPDSDVEWRLRYAPDRGAELVGASVCSIYKNLVWMPRRRRDKLIAEIRRASQLNASKGEG